MLIIIQPFVFQGSIQVPIFIMEVKQSVSLFPRLNVCSVGQILVQSYYALRNYPIEFIVSCLTDGNMFHFFKITARDPASENSLAPLVDIVCVHSESVRAKAIGSISAFLKQGLLQSIFKTD